MNLEKKVDQKKKYRLLIYSLKMQAIREKEGKGKYQKYVDTVKKLQKIKNENSLVLIGDNDDARKIEYDNMMDYICSYTDYDKETLSKICDNFVVEKKIEGEER